MGDECMAKIVDFSAFYTCNFKVTVYGSADIANEKPLAAFGDKEGFTFSVILSNFKIHVECFSPSFV